MPTVIARRGRPKGSGLDDRVQLEAIANLLKADPSLKPTTAIKLVGVTDPSTIRRLRDKLRRPAEEAEPIELEPKARVAAPQTPRTRAREAALDAMPSDVVREVAKPVAARREGATAAPSPASSSAPAQEPASVSVADAKPTQDYIDTPRPQVDLAAALEALLTAKSAVDAEEKPAPERISDHDADLSAAVQTAAHEWFTHWCAFGLHALAATAEAQRLAMLDMLRSPQVAFLLKQQVKLNEVAKAFCPKSPDVRSNEH